MLANLITSKNRLRLLVKFFITAGNEDFLRGLATELHENRNAVHKEWNNLDVNCYSVREEQESKIFYHANKQRTFFSLLQQIVRKCIWLDYIIEAFVSNLGEVLRIFLIGDHTKFFATGAMEVVIEGPFINLNYLEQLKQKIERNLKNLSHTQSIKT